MPELPEVETTRRGIEPAAARPAHRGTERPRSAPALAGGPRAPAAAARAAHPQDRTARQVPAAQAGRGHADPAPRNVRQPARAGADAPRRACTITSTCCSASGRVLRFNDPRRFGSLLYTTAPPHRAPAAAAPRPRATRAGIRRGLPVPHHPRPARRDQAAAHERATRDRRRQHLCERGAVPRTHRTDSAPPGAHPWQTARAWCAASARCSRLAIRSGGTTLRDYVGADGDPGYFRQKLYVYERAGRACRAAAR